MTVPELIAEARRRGIRVLSITDHDSIECQESVEALAGREGIHFITGLELNVSFSHQRYRDGKPVSLDLLAYGFDYTHPGLLGKILELKRYRKHRAELILERINVEFKKEGRAPFTPEDLRAIEETVDGAFGRPHIANYMVARGMVAGRQEAFDRYLTRCDVPKMPVSLEEASVLVHEAGGRVALAHPNDPNGTSLAALSTDVSEQIAIIREKMLPMLDGVECWHPRHGNHTVSAYVDFAGREGLLMTGGSDCHQQPVIMGTVSIPEYVLEQFGIDPRSLL
jgi:hypothetical protein